MVHATHEKNKGEGLSHHVDVAILGAGLVGAVTALFLRKGGLRVAIIEANDLTDSLSPPSLKKDRRTTAVSYGSSLILKEAGVWDDLEPYTSPIYTIKTFEAHTPFSIVFDQELLKQSPQKDSPLGYMVDNHTLRTLFHNALKKDVQLPLKTNTRVETFTPTDGAVMLSLSDGTSLHAKLIIGAEGRHSPSRRHFGIRSFTRDYGHTALVAEIFHEKPHDYTAFEVFHPKGPLAFLPMADEIATDSLETQDCPFPPHKSAIVWSCADPLEHLPHDSILERIFELFPHLGNLHFATPPVFYPLSYQKTSSLVGSRYALVGDAAHVMHPVAGQGVNLGWRDAQILSQKITQAFSLGLDIASMTVLKEYALHRKKDQIPLLITTHSLIKLFGIEPKGPITRVIQLARSYGLGLVNRSPTLKRFLMKKAMGI